MEESEGDGRQRRESSGAATDDLLNVEELLASAKIDQQCTGGATNSSDEEDADGSPRNGDGHGEPLERAGLSGGRRQQKGGTEAPHGRGAFGEDEQQVPPQGSTLFSAAFARRAVEGAVQLSSSTQLRRSQGESQGGGAEGPTMLSGNRHSSQLNLSLQGGPQSYMMRSFSNGSVGGVCTCCVCNNSQPFPAYSVSPENRQRDPQGGLESCQHELPLRAAFDPRHKQRPVFPLGSFGGAGAWSSSAGSLAFPNNSNTIDFGNHGGDSRGCADGESDKGSTSRLRVMEEILISLVRKGDGAWLSSFCFLLSVLAVGLTVGIVVMPTLWTSRAGGSDQDFFLTGGGGGLKFAENPNASDGNSKPHVYFEDVHGMEEAKLALLEIVQFFRTPEKFERLGARMPRGILLEGAPGTGKTMLAKAVAAEANVSFVYASGSEFVEVYVGQGARRIRQLFATARERAPAVIFIDELDAVGAHRSSGGASGFGGGNREADQTLNQLLVEMDGFSNTVEGGPIVVLAATNRADVLDHALLRAGRFDRVITVPLPDTKAREAILRHYMASVALSPELAFVRGSQLGQGSDEEQRLLESAKAGEAIDLEISEAKRLAADSAVKDLAKATTGFSGADLSNVVNEAAILAATNNATHVTLDHLHDARDKVVAGPERRSLIISQKQKEMTAIHEAGHALVATLLIPDADPVLKATIVTRAHSLGHVEQSPEEERFTFRFSEARARLTVAMAGRAAELLTYGGGGVSSGASGDFRQATRLAEKMVTEWGMSDKVGPLHAAGGMPGWSTGGGRPLSEQMAAEVDKEVMRFLNEAHELALQLLRSNEGALQALANELLDKETLDGDAVRALIAKTTSDIEAAGPNMSPPSNWHSFALPRPDDQRGLFLGMTNKRNRIGGRTARNAGGRMIMSGWVDGLA